MWIPINEQYATNELGEIKNVKTQRILKPFNQGKYLGVWLGVGNKHYIHRLVADRFLPSPTGDCVVDHIDRNKHNNCASNLRWVSHTENMENRTLELKPRQSNKSGEHHIKVILSDRQVNPSYVVMIDTKRCGKAYQCFKNLEEAKTWRDTILNAL